MTIIVNFAKISVVNDIQVCVQIYRGHMKNICAVFQYCLSTVTIILFFFRSQLLGHRQALLEHLTSSEDPALVLHLTTLIMFQAVTQTMLHASGRFVSHILTYLQSHVTAEVFNTLQQYHGEFFIYHPQKTDREGDKYFGFLMLWNIIHNLVL